MLGSSPVLQMRESSPPRRQPPQPGGGNARASSHAFHTIVSFTGSPLPMLCLWSCRLSSHLDHLCPAPYLSETLSMPRARSWAGPLRADPCQVLWMEPSRLTRVPAPWTEEAPSPGASLALPFPALPSVMCCEVSCQSGPGIVESLRGSGSHPAGTRAHLPHTSRGPWSLKPQSLTFLSLVSHLPRRGSPHGSRKAGTKTKHLETEPSQRLLPKACPSLASQLLGKAGAGAGPRTGSPWQD